MPFPTSANFLTVTNGFFTPDVVEIVVPLVSQQTNSGYISPMQQDKEDYVSSGITFPAYSYLATGRFLSTQVSPTEYGDREALDSLMVLIYIDGKTEAELAYIRPTQVVRLYRKEYTADSGKLYRLVTGNPYQTHFEYRLVPLPE